MKHPSHVLLFTATHALTLAPGQPSHGIPDAHNLGSHTPPKQLLPTNRTPPPHRKRKSWPPPRVLPSNRTPRLLHRQGHTRLQMARGSTSRSIVAAPWREKQRGNGPLLEARDWRCYCTGGGGAQSEPPLLDPFYNSLEGERWRLFSSVSNYYFIHYCLATLYKRSFFLQLFFWTAHSSTAQHSTAQHIRHRALQAFEKRTTDSSSICTSTSILSPHKHEQNGQELLNCCQSAPVHLATSPTTTAPSSDTPMVKNRCSHLRRRLRLQNLPRHHTRPAPHQRHRQRAGLC